MPWSTPSLREVRTMVRDSVNASLPGADANVPNSVLRVMADTEGALCHLTLQYIDWLSLQLLPDTAEAEWLDRHGTMWLVNSDGSTGRKLATLSSGTATFSGLVPGSIIPTGTQLETAARMPDGVDSLYDVVTFETLADITTSTLTDVTGPIRALDPGTQGNLPPGTGMEFRTPVDGVSQTAAIVTVGGGTDAETDNQLRARILKRIRNPPMGGDKNDYEQWALAVPGVTRAWCAPNEMGIGTVTVRFMMDDLRAATGGFPNADDIATVTAYLDTVRPVAVKDRFVVAPIPCPASFTISGLVKDSSSTRQAIIDSVSAMITDRAAPGETMWSAWVADAILEAPGVDHFRLIMDDLVMPNAGSMAVLGDVIFQ